MANVTLFILLLDFLLFGTNYALDHELDHGSFGASDDSESFTFKVPLPPMKTKEVNRYVCYSKSLEELGETYITGLLTEPDYEVGPHHVDSGLCLSPLHENAAWECERGQACTGDAVEFSVTDNFNHVKNPHYKLPTGVSSRVNHGTEKHFLIVQVHLYEPLTTPASPGNITLTYRKTPTKYFYQKYMLSSGGYVPAHHPAGFMANTACRWKRPEVLAFDYYIHTHDHGLFAEGFLIHNKTWRYLGGQRTQERMQEQFKVVNGPVRIRPGDVLASRCLYVNKEDNPVIFGKGENCIFQLSVAYEARYHDSFLRPPICRTKSPDFSFCDSEDTSELCDQ